MDPSSPDYLLQNLTNVYTDPDPRTYPLSSYVYMIEPTGTYPSPETNDHDGKRQSIADFAYYSICQGQKEIGPIGYSPLPVNLVEAGFGQINKLQQADPGVDLTTENILTCNNPTFVLGPAEHQLPGHHRPPASGLRPDRRRSVRGRGDAQRHRRHTRPPRAPTRDVGGRRRRVGRRVPAGRARRRRRRRLRSVGAAAAAAGAAGGRGAVASRRTARRLLGTTTTTEPHYRPGHAAGIDLGARLATLWSWRRSCCSLVVFACRWSSATGGHAVGSGVSHDEARRRHWRAGCRPSWSPAVLSGPRPPASARSAAGRPTTSAAPAVHARPRRSPATNVVNGSTRSSTPVRSRSMSSQTTNLQGRQEIDVSWSGAHPTGGIVADQNSVDAQDEEYPFVLLECRGVDSTASPAADQLSPETCWTQTWSEHYQDSFGDAYPPYRLDEYATAADRGADRRCARHPLPAVVPVRRVRTGPALGALRGRRRHRSTTGGTRGCAGAAPEADDVGGSALPSNETFGVTGTDGTGSAEFDVWTSARERLAGCSQTVPCSLVAVPDHGHQLRPVDGGPSPASRRRPRVRGAPVPSRPGQLMPATGRRRADCQRQPVVEPLELAEPDHGAADVRHAADACSVVDQRPEQRRSTSTDRSC